MVTTSDWLIVAMVIQRAMSSGAIWSSDGRSSHVGVVAWTVVASTRSKSSVASSRSDWDSGNLRIAKLTVMLLTLPELGTGAASVVVGRSRAKALLLLVVTA